VLSNKLMAGAWQTQCRRIATALRWQWQTACAGYGKPMDLHLHHSFANAQKGSQP